MDTAAVEKAYASARERYAEYGVDTERALERLRRIAVSVHCWQGDDVGGFENAEGLSGGGIMAAMFLMALRYRNRTGRGQLIDISQTENAQCTFAPAFIDYFMNGRVQGTLGNRDTTMAPQGVYLCKVPEYSRGGEDNWWALSVENDEQWQALCRVMGQPELADDPRFADVISR